MSTLQLQARALGDPTRHAIFQYVLDAGDSAEVGVAELTSHFKLNHNAIRQHLAKLVDAGLVTESVQRTGGRGRPKLMYRVESKTESRWAGVGPYERLSRLLAEIIRTGDDPVEVGRRAVGRQHGADVLQDDPVAKVTDLMARLGFEPEVRQRGSHVDVVLHKCPFESAVLVDPDTVCALHLGMARGAAEQTEGLVVDQLVVKDPRRAMCRLRCHLTGSPG